MEQGGLGELVQPHQPSPCRGAGGMLGPCWGGKVGFCSDGEAAAVLAWRSTGQFPAVSAYAVAALQQRCGLRAPIAASLHVSQQKMALMGAWGTAKSSWGLTGPYFCPSTRKIAWAPCFTLMAQQLQHQIIWLLADWKGFYYILIKIKPAMDCRSFVTRALL